MTGGAGGPAGDRAPRKAAVRRAGRRDPRRPARHAGRGPEELLVAAKIAISRDAEGDEVAAAIDAAESRVRAVVPTAHMIRLEPDLLRADPAPR